ncbi:unnamed protein product [Calypogeia fissa]
MILGQVYLEELQETPPRILEKGDCLEYIFPRKHNDIFGAIEACMHENCNFEIRERRIPLPHYESSTVGQGSDCFLKLQDKGGLDILDDFGNPRLVKTLIDNNGPKASDMVGYEITLEDTYQVQADYAKEYEAGRFTKEPTLMIRRYDWRWFVKDHAVNSEIVSTLPQANLSTFYY